MSDFKNKYFSTGEFAKLFDIHKKTLFHYDEIGLFHPDKVLENGYRYYSTAQVELFDTILQLKRLGIPLKEIQYFINHRTPEMVIDFFTKEQAHIESQIQVLEHLKKTLNIKTRLIQSALNFPTEITLERQDTEYFILSKKTQPANIPFDFQTYTEHLKHCFTHKLDIGYPAGSMLSTQKLYEKHYFEPDYFFTKVETQPTEYAYIKPQGLYVVGYLKGFYDKTPLLYKRLLSFIKENNLEIEGYAYEDYLIDLLSTQNPEDIVIKVSIKTKEVS